MTRAQVPASEVASGVSGVSGDPVASVPGYRLERLIGRGATGEVWLGHQPGQRVGAVAIKRLACDDPASRQRLRAEGRLLGRLDHPHIVPLFDVVDCGDGVALVMAHAAGGSLAALLSQRRLTAGQLVSIAVPLAEALAYAHGTGVVHADVTPANVLFTDDGRPLLADFGLARLAAPLRSRAALAGTPDYLDPELVEGAAPDPRSDIYALGVICWEALAGRRPHAAATPLEVVERAAQADRPALAALAPDAPAALVAAIETALARRREGRYAAAGEFAAALRAALAPEPVRMLPRLVPVPVATPARPTRDFGPRPQRAEPAPTGVLRWWQRLGAWHSPAALRLAALLALAAVVGASGAAVARRGWAGMDTDGPHVTAPKAAASTAAPSHTSPGLQSPRSIARPVAPVPPSGTVPRDADEWRGVLAALDARRTEAYARADAGMLADVYSGGEVLRVDSQRVAALAAAGESVVGLRPRYTRVGVTAVTPTEVVLRVDDELPPYRRLGRGGKVLEQYRGRGPARWVVKLVGRPGGWRIRAVAAAP